MTDLAADRKLIGSSLDEHLRASPSRSPTCSSGARPVLKSDIAELRRLAKLLNKKKNREVINELFDRLPESMTDQTRTGTYGSWYSYYVCGFSGEIKLPEGLDDLPVITPAPAAAQQPQLPLAPRRGAPAGRCG